MKDSERMQGPRELLECGHPESEHSDITRGYGRDDQGNRYCYTCCANRDRETMIQEGKYTLYLTKNEQGLWKVSNWPGSLEFKPYYVKEWKASAWGGYIDAATAYFVGPDGYVWSAINKGDNEIARCRRTRDKVKDWHRYPQVITKPQS